MRPLRFSLPAGRAGVLLLGGALLAVGCSRPATPPAGSETASGTDRPPVQAPPAAAPPPPPTPEPRGAGESSAESSRAEAAFRRLTASDVSVEEWEAAYQELEGLGAAAATVLQRGLRSSNGLIREWSASILAANWEAAAQSVPELIACLDSPNAGLRANAAAALALVPGQESRAVPVLLELARSSDVSLRRMAAVNLQNLGSATAAHLDDLQPLLEDDDPEVVRAVMELLGRLGRSAGSALPRLRQIAFESKDEQLQAAARQAIQLIVAEEGEK